jgi:predicted SprT family Zn-dependent metalloprotease
MNLKIPKSFQLHGQTIEVAYVDHIGSESGTLGEAHIAKNRIVLQNNASGFARSDSQIEQTFLHELVHFILIHLGQNELCDQEPFVDGFAHLLHQALSSMTYGPITKTKTMRGKNGK